MKKRKQIWKYLLFMSALVFLGAASLGYFFKRDDIGRFRQVCRSIQKDDSFEKVRLLSQENNYVLELDPDPVGNSPFPVFVLRPDFKWPTRFGCRIVSEKGHVLRVGR